MNKNNNNDNNNHNNNNNNNDDHAMDNGSTTPKPRLWTLPDETTDIFSCRQDYEEKG